MPLQEIYHPPWTNDVSATDSGSRSPQRHFRRQGGIQCLTNINAVGINVATGFADNSSNFTIDYSGTGQHIAYIEDFYDVNMTRPIVRCEREVCCRYRTNRRACWVRCEGSARLDLCERVQRHCRLSFSPVSSAGVPVPPAGAPVPPAGAPVLPAVAHLFSQQWRTCSSSRCTCSATLGTSLTFTCIYNAV